MALPNDINLRINEACKEAKKAGRDVINGTIGMMFLEDGTLPIHPLLRDSFLSHFKDEDLYYPSVAGNPSFRKATIDWFFASKAEKEYEEGRMQCLATPGGTGALSASMHSVARRKTCFLIPSIGWPNYESQVETSGGTKIHYDYFEGDGFALGGLAKRFKEASSFDSICLLLNDPCHNPTGYCLSEKEWDALIGLLNSYKGKVSLILDCAYMDFVGEENGFDIFDKLKKLDEEILVYLCFSFSKTFSLYGVRIGALGIYGKKALVDDSFKACCRFARATWSLPNNMAMNAISDLLGKEEGVKAMREETALIRRQIARRASSFLKECTRLGLKPLPYRDGFFISFEVKNALCVVTFLMEKDIFIAPASETAVRVAICCLKESELPIVAEALSEAIRISGKE